MKQSTYKLLIKSIFLTIFVSLLGLWSCDQVYDLPVKPKLDTSTEFLMFSLEGGQMEIDFTANRFWKAELLNNIKSDGSEWCTLSVDSGGSGKQKIYITVNSLDGDYREAKLLLNCSGTGKEIPIMQSGTPVVKTADSTYIDESNVTLNGAWYYSGKINVAEIGFALAPQSTKAYVNNKFVTDSIQQGVFSEKISGLSSSTVYLYKAYIKTATGEYYYGVEKIFKTDEEPIHLAVKDLVVRGKALAVGGSTSLTASEYIKVAVSNVSEASDFITLSLVDYDCTADVAAGKSVANYGISTTIQSNSTTLGKYKVGDVLKIRTKGGILSNVKGNPLYSISNLANISVLESGITINPVTVSHTELNNYLAMYVAVKNTQITKSYLNSAIYTAWGNTSFTMEVNNSEESYIMRLPTGATFTSDPVLTGSGTLKGIVSPATVDYLISPRSAADLADLTHERFMSLLGLRFFPPVFNGILTINEASKSYISIPYKNGDNTIVPATITISMSGEAAVGLSTSTLINPVVGNGIGSLIIGISGTPTLEGEITFTVNGFDSYIQTKTVTATVIKPIIAEIGNFEAVWDVSSSNYATTVPFKTNTNPSITVTNLVATNFNGSASTTKYTKDLATIGCDLNTVNNKLMNPSRYVSTSIKVGAGKTLNLSGLDYTCRSSGGDSQVSLQYSLDGTNFIEIDNRTPASGIQGTIILAKFNALKSVSEGTTVTFRIVPINASGAAKWGINGNNTTRGLAIYGNVVNN